MPKLLAAIYEYNTYTNIKEINNIFFVITILK